MPGPEISQGQAAVAAPRGTTVPWLIPVLGLLTMFGPMAIDMYLPGLPAIGRDFGADQATVQLTLSWFLVAFGVGQLAWGPLGDRYGRKAPAAAGILLFVVGSVGCALAGSVEGLAGWRFVQGLGAGAAPVLARAMVRDSFDRDRAASTMSLMMLVMGVAPMLAPLAGGQVLAHSGWRTIFWVLAGFGLVALAGLATLRETLPRDRRVMGGGAQALRGYLFLIRDRRFLGYVLSSGFVFAGMFAYIAGTPYVYIEYFGVAPQHYGLLFGLNVVGMMLVNTVNSRLVLRLGTDPLMRAGTAVAATMGCVLLAAGASGFGGLWGIVVPLVGYLGMTGLVGANGMAGALARVPERAGAASALAGTLQLGLGAGTGWLVGHFADGTPVPMCAVIAACGLLALGVNLTLVKRG